MSAALPRRRRFLSLAGGLAAWPLGAFGQTTATPLIGLLSSFSAALTEKRISHFGRGLGELGYALGRDVRLTVRAADNQFARLPRLAAELVEMRAALIATLGQPAADAARAATSTIPIVFVSALDPVTGGVLRSLGRPGGNLAGVTFVAASLGPKRLELLREIAPRGALIAMLANPNSVETNLELKDVQAAAASLHQPLLVLNASNPGEIAAAFAEAARRRAELRGEHQCRLVPGGHLRGQDPEGREAGGSSGRPAGQGRAGSQPEGGQGTGIDVSAVPARARGRGDRVARSLRLP